MELCEIRNEIDKIDAELVELYKKRMALSANVAEYKRENNMPILDSSRERALLNKVSELSGKDFEEYTRTLYGTILDLSRSYQHKILGNTSALYSSIKNAIDNTEKIFPERASVACQGVEGAYSQVAAEKTFPSAFNNLFF